MDFKQGDLVQMANWLYENEGEDCSMLVPSDSYPGKLYGIVISVEPKNDPNCGYDKYIAEVLFNDGLVINIATSLLREFNEPQGEY